MGDPLPYDMRSLRERMTEAENERYELHDTLEANAEARVSQWFNNWVEKKRSDAALEVFVEKMAAKYRSIPEVTANVSETLTRLQVQDIGEVAEVSMVRADGSVYIFKKPTVSASLMSQCFVVSGEYELVVPNSLVVLGPDVPEAFAPVDPQ